MTFFQRLAKFLSTGLLAFITGISLSLLMNFMSGGDSEHSTQISLVSILSLIALGFLYKIRSEIDGLYQGFIKLHSAEDAWKNACGIKQSKKNWFVIAFFFACITFLPMAFGAIYDTFILKKEKRTNVEIYNKLTEMEKKMKTDTLRTMIRCRDSVAKNKKTVVCDTTVLYSK